MNSSYIERYKDNHKKKETNWFEKTVTSAVTSIGAAGVVYGIWKMKGPFRKLLDQNNTRNLNDFFNSELRKYDSRPVDEILKSFKSAYVATARDLTSEFESRIDSSVFDHLNTAQSLKDKITSKEKSVFDAYERLFRQNSTLPQNIIALKDQPPPLSSAVNQEIASDSLARAKQRAIVKYIAKYGSGKGKTTYAEAMEDVEFYNTEEYFGGDTIKDAKNKDLVKRTNTVHDSLIDTQEYAVIYNDELTPIADKARQVNAEARKAVIENQSKIVDNKKVRSMLYGNLGTGKKADIAMLRETSSTILASRKTGVFADRINGLTSGGTRPIQSTHALISKLGAFEYSSHIKRIVSILDNALEENIGLEDYKISVDSFIDSTGEKRYLKLEFLHKNSTKWYEAKIALATNGVVPFLTPESAGRAEKLFIVGDAVGVRKWDDSRVKYLNSTQLALSDLADMLESAAFRGIDSFSDNPQGFGKKLNRVTGHVYNDLAPTTGALRDIIQQFGITPRFLSLILNPGSVSPASMKSNLNNFTLNVAHMDRIRKMDRKTAVITIDLESLSNKKSGPDKLVNDPENQFVKAGLYVSDIKDGNRMLHSEELSSAHGYDYYNKNGFSASLKEWLRKNVVPGGQESPDIVKAYEKYLKDSGARTDIKNSRQFFAELKTKIDVLETEYKNKGYDVIYVTKNGASFDLRAMEYYLGPDYIKKLKDNHIDIQATASVLKKAYFEPGALSQERMLQELLRKTGAPELATMITRGHDNRKTQAILTRVLRHLRRPKAGFGPMFEMTNKQLLNLSKMGSLHASPVLDSLITSALFKQQYQEFLTNPEMSQVAGNITKVLKSAGGTRGATSIFDVVKDMEDQMIPGWGVMTFSAASHGMIHNMTASIVGLSDILPFPDNTVTKQWNQRLGQVFDISPSTRWLTKHGNLKTTSLAYKKAFGQFMATEFVNEVNKIHYPKVDEARNAFTKTAMAKGVYTLDPNRWGDDASRILVRDTFMGGLKFSHTVDIQLDDLIHSDPLLHNDILNYDAQARLKLAELFPKDSLAVTQPTMEQLEKAYAALSADGLPLNMENSILSAHKFSGQTKISTKGVKGRLLHVVQTSDPNGGVAKLMAKIVLELDGMQVGKMSPQARLTGARAIVTMAQTLADGNAFGVPKGMDFAADGTFIRKGYIGATKEILFGNVMYHAYEKWHQAVGQDKEDLGRAIKAMATKAKATADPSNFTLIFKRQDPSKISAFARYVGDMDMTVSDITEFARTHKILTWTDKDINEIEQNASKKAAYTNYEKALNQHIDDLQKTAQSNNGCLGDLKREETEKFLIEAKTMRSLLDRKVGGAKLVTVHDYSGSEGKGGHGSYMLGIESFDYMSFYGINSMDGPFDPRFRSDYFAAIKNSRFIDPDSVSWMRQYPFYARHEEYRHAKHTFQQFDDAIMGKLTMKPMSLESIRLFTRTQEHIDVNKVVRNLGTSLEDKKVTIAGAVDQLQRLIAAKTEEGETAAVQHYEEQAEALRSVLDKKHGKEMLSSFRKSSKFYTHAEVESFREFANVKGTEGTIALPLIGKSSSDVYEMNIDEEVRKLCGQLVGDKTLTKEQIIQRADIIKQNLRAVDKDAAAKMLMHVDDNGNLVLRGNSLVMPWDPHMPNMFNQLAPDTWLSNPETEVKLEVMRQLERLHEVKNKKDTPEYVTRTEKFNRELMRYMLLGFPAGKDSKLWMSNQYEPPGIKKYHMGIEQIMMNAQSWMDQLDAGNAQINPHFKNKGFSTKNALGNLLNASLNTVAITESAFREAIIPDMISEKGKYVKDAGTEIKYADALEKSLGRDNFDKIAKGQRYLSGGIMYRFPVTQSANHSLIDVNYLVVPDEVGEVLGMNSNTYYAHSILSALQGSDSDGDFAVLHFREFKDMASMTAASKKNREILQEIVNASQLQNILKSNKVKTDSSGNVTEVVKLGVANRLVHWKGGKGIVSSYEVTDDNLIVNRFHSVNEELIDSSESVKQIVELAKGVARQQVSNTNGSQWFNTEMIRSQLPAISKQLIPSATNLLKKVNAQILTAAQAGRLPAGVAMADIMGTINHGLAGVLGQLPIELGKHIDPQKLAGTMMVMDYWNDPDHKMADKKLAFDHYNSMYDEWDNAPSLEKRREMFDFITDEMRTANRMAKLSPEARNYDYSFANIFMGRKGASFWDMRNLTRDFDYNVLVRDDPSVMSDFISSFKSRFKIDSDTSAIFRKGGKAAGIGAASLLALSFFRPFSNSESLNPIDAFIDVGPNVEDRVNLISSPLELSRSNPLDMVNASFSKEAFIKLNNNGTNVNKQRATIINSILKGSQIIQPYDMYEFKYQPNVRYSNYTMNIPSMGTSDLSRRSQL